MGQGIGGYLPKGKFLLPERSMLLDWPYLCPLLKDKWEYLLVFALWHMGRFTPIPWPVLNMQTMLRLNEWSSHSAQSRSSVDLSYVKYSLVLKPFLATDQDFPRNRFPYNLVFSHTIKTLHAYSWYFMNTFHNLSSCNLGHFCCVKTITNLPVHCASMISLLLTLQGM